VNLRYTIQQRAEPEPEPVVDVVVELRKLADGSVALYACGHFIVEVLGLSGKVVPFAAHGTHQERFDRILAQLQNAPR